MTLPNKRFVVVTWHDAADFKEKGWANAEDLKEFNTEPVLCVSVGWLLSNTKRGGVVIAADWSPPIKPKDIEDWGRITKIPRKMVVSVETYPALPVDNPPSP